MRVTAVADDTALAGIARLMDEAGQSRSRYVRIADRASRLYAPAVHSLAAIAFVGWMIAGAGWHQSLVIAIAVLIITCPCAMGLAVPAAQVVASGALIRKGLLVKDGSALERLAEVDTALFDKTGTLTLGELRADVAGLDQEAKSIALALAQQSRHPLSLGLARSLTAMRVAPAELSDVREVGGEGVTGRWREIDVALERPAVPTSRTSVALRIGEAIRIVGFEDQSRSDAKTTLSALESLGLRSAIISGDDPAAVAGVAAELAVSYTHLTLPTKRIV